MLVIGWLVCLVNGRFCKICANLCARAYTAASQHTEEDNNHYEEQFLLFIYKSVI
jgi:hypothetical protein